MSLQFSGTQLREVEVNKPWQVCLLDQNTTDSQHFCSTTAFFWYLSYCCLGSALHGSLPSVTALVNSDLGSFSEITASCVISIPILLFPFLRGGRSCSCKCFYTKTSASMIELYSIICMCGLSCLKHTKVMVPCKSDGSSGSPMSSYQSPPEANRVLLSKALLLPESSEILSFPTATFLFCFLSSLLLLSQLSQDFFFFFKS